MDANAPTTLRDLLSRQSDARAPSTSASMAEPESEDELPVSGIGRVGTRPQLTLLFRKADGSGRAFAYSTFLSIEFEEPNSEFTIVFATGKVKVTGRNLDLVLRRICQHRQAEVAELGQAASLHIPQNAPAIECIELITAKDTGSYR